MSHECNDSNCQPEPLISKSCSRSKSNFKRCFTFFLAVANDSLTLKINLFVLNENLSLSSANKMSSLSSSFLSLKKLHSKQKIIVMSKVTKPQTYRTNFIF